MIRAALALLGALAAPALADPADDAKQLYADGKKHFDIAEYPQAIDAWKKAYVLSSAPMLLFNIGQAYRLSGECADALRFYANYQREAGAQLDNADELAEARSRCNPSPKDVNPPFVERPGAPPTHHGDGGSWKIGAIATGSAGVVLVVAGGFLAGAAHSNETKVAQFRGEWTPAQSSIQSDGKRDALLSDLAFGIGGAAVVAGVLQYYLGVREDHRVIVGIAPHGASFTVRF
ncbi:MAG TPA: hypothetical protein VGM88_28150 [Kofleriaceae bacterium]|jgi:tetratricopeptide (TPR) repeat protein